jgi:hypothetical protein
MKANVRMKIITAALCTAGLISAPLAVADTINGTLVPPLPQSVVPTDYTVTYPVTVAIVGQGVQNLSFVYNGATGVWTAPPGYTYDASLNPNANTAVFTTVQGGVAYGVALSSTGATQFVPGQTGGVTVPPSVGTVAVNTVVTNTTLPGFAAATANGAVIGKGQTTATLVGAPIVAQIIGVGQGGTPVGTAVPGTPIAVDPGNAQSAVGSASGAVTVNSNQPVQAVGYGSYTATFPTTATPPGTASVAGTISGNGGSFSSSGINIGPISGTASYNTLTGVVTASPVFTAGFSVNANGNTQIGCAGANTDTTANLTVCNNATVLGHTETNGLSNNGFMSTGSLAVTGATATNGLQNHGALGTTTLAVSGATTLNGTLGVGGLTSTSGISNTGALTTTTLGVTGNATLGGNVTASGTLGVTGATTLNGATQVNNTLGVTGATTIGSTAGTGGNTLSVSSSGITLSTPGVGANAVVVTSDRSSITGGGASMTMANGRATFAGANTSPITVTGIADGQNQFDAVNFGQFQQLEKDMSRGISGATAVANIPQVDQGKPVALGIGVGGFNGETAFAIGGSARVAKDGVIKASVGFAGGGGSNTVWGVGGVWNW